MKTMNIDLDRLKIANKVLAIIAKDVSILEDGRVRFPVWPYGSKDFKVKKWKSLSAGSPFPTWHRHFAHGGTVTNALYQLIRWVQGKPVVGVGQWRHWCGPSIALGRHRGGEVIGLLESVWPKTECVLCGRSLTRYDWWGLKDKVGPCCWHDEGCRQQGN